MKTLQKIIKWCIELNNTTAGDILVWTFFTFDFIAIWLFTYMFAG